MIGPKEEEAGEGRLTRRALDHYMMNMGATTAKGSIPYNPELLRWAREEAGFTHEEAAQRAGITPPRKVRGEAERSPADRLHSWELGDDSPSLPQLEAIAKAYRRPLITFFLATPPIITTSLADFRTVSDQPSSKDSPEFAALKRRLEALHDFLKELAEQDDSPPLSFIGSMSSSAPVDEIVSNIREILNFSFSFQERLPNSDDLLRELRKKVHDVGIFVLFEGNLGSHHTKISPTEFRGIAFSHVRAPLIVVNPNDSKAAQLFTLAHELGHMWIGSSGVSNYDALGKTSSKEHIDNERICNSIAAELLAPEEALRSTLREDIDLPDLISHVSRTFKVSKAVIARRLLDLGYITENTYWPIFKEYQAAWKRNKEVLKETEGGPGRNKMDRFRLGDKLIHTVIGAAMDGRVTLQDAARLLHVPVSRFDKVSR